MKRSYNCNITKSRHFEVQVSKKPYHRLAACLNLADMFVCVHDHSLSDLEEQSKAEIAILALF